MARNCWKIGSACLFVAWLVAPAFAGELTMEGNVNVASNLVANGITLSGATNLTNAVLDFTQPGLFYRFTLTNDTTWVFTNHVAGRQVWLQIAQDDTGGRFNIWPAGLLWPGGTQVDLPFSANSLSVFKVLDNGTAWLVQAEGSGYAVSSNYALRFDGSQNHVSASGSADLFPEDMTIEFWANPSGMTNLGEIAGFITPDASAGWGLNIRADFVQFISQGSGTTVAYCNSSFTAANAWQHFAVCFSRTNGLSPRIWMNGVEVTSGNGSGGDVPTSAELWVGASPFADPNVPRTYAGALDDFRLSKVLRYTNDFTPDSCRADDSDTIVYWKFNEGSGPTVVDSSGNGHAGTLQGDPLPTWVTGIACGWSRMNLATRSESSVRRLSTMSLILSNSVSGTVTGSIRQLQSP